MRGRGTAGGSTIVGGDGSGTIAALVINKIGGVAVTTDTDGTLAANSDAKLASQKATKTYADTKLASTAQAADTAKILTVAPGASPGFMALVPLTTKATLRAAMDLDTGNSPTWTGGTFTGDLAIQGNLQVTGGIETSSSTAVDVEAAYIYQNLGYKSDPAVTGGKVVNYDPTTTTTNVAAGGFVAGVAAVSNPTIAVASVSGFAAADIVMVSGTASNDGFYEVLTAAAGVITVKGVGLTTTVEAWSRTQVNTSITVAGTVTKVNVSILRTGTDGLWEVGKGSASGITYGDLSYVGGTDVLVADGGTGSSTASGARANLGAISGVAVSTDVTIPQDLGGFVVSGAGAWTITGQGSGQQRLRRTAGTGNADTATLPLRGLHVRSTASVGEKITTITVHYRVTVDTLNEFTLALWSFPLPATGNAASASSVAFSYDGSHDTTAKRVAIGFHTIVITVTSQAYANLHYSLDCIGDGTGHGTAVLDVIAWDVQVSEIPVDTVA